MDSAKISETPEIKLHFLDYWRIIRLRKGLILTVFLLVVTTVTALTFWVLPEKFGSMVRIMVEQDSPDVSVQDRQFVRHFDPFFLETQFQIITSSEILKEVIKNLKLDEVFAKQNNEQGALPTNLAYEQLKRQLKVRQTRNSSLIEIWVYSTDKILAANIANEIAKVYKDFRLKQWKETRSAGVKKFQEQLGTIEKEVADAEATLSKMRTDLKIPDLEGAPFALPTLYPNPNDTHLDFLARELSLAKEKLLSASQTFGPLHDEYKKAKSIVEDLDKQINAKVVGIVQGLKSRVASEKGRLDKLQSGLEEELKTYNELAAQYAPYFSRKLKLDSDRKFKEVLRQRVSTEGMEAEQPLTTVRVTDIAEPGERPDSPNKPLNIVLGIFVGLMVGIGLAFFIEYLDTSVKTIDDVERSLQAAVLGVIPQNVEFILDEGMDSPHAEAYRVLRTNVLFSRKDENWKTISVLSGGAGEGKSTTLLNLATIFAQNGSRVLVVDSDLRRPSIHKTLKLTNALGLTNYLLKQNTIEEVIQKTKLPTLDFMASGKLPSSSMGILSSVQMKALIQELKLRYDFVFFDSPPLLGVSDASILASEMDMLLQVIQYRRYPQPMTIRAKQMINKVGGNLLGIVLNNINMSSDESYYYYSGYYDYQASKHDDSTVVKLSEAAAKSGKEQAKIEIKQKY
jgi:succinoglycan biosynthesis transport protein ExoP